MKPFFFTVKMKKRFFFSGLSSQKFFCMCLYFYGSDQNCYIFKKRNTVLELFANKQKHLRKNGQAFHQVFFTRNELAIYLGKMENGASMYSLYYYHDTTIHYLLGPGATTVNIKVYSGDVCHHFLPKDRIDFTLEQIHCQLC